MRKEKINNKRGNFFFVIVLMIMIVATTTSVFAAFPSNPVQVLEFNTNVAQNGALPDAVGLHNGNNTGGAEYGSDTGKLNGAYYFDGTKIMTTAYAPQGGEFTVCIWGNTTDGNR